jgi:hypothetical protein
MGVPIVQVIVTIFYVILNQYIVTPIMYALHPAYAPILNNPALVFGGLIVFLLDNIGFFFFIALAIWIWKGLQHQDTQNTYYNGVGGQ